MSIYTEGMTFGSIDLGIENLGVWAGRARVRMADPEVKVPVTKGRWSSNDKSNDESKEDEELHDALSIHTRDRSYTFETLYWERINLVEGVPTTVKMIKKKMSSALHRKIIKAPIDVQVDYATRKDRIPAIIERFKELGVTHVLIESQLTNLGQKGGPHSMSGNILMKVLSHVIQVLVRIFLPDATITFVSGHSTIPLCEDVMWAPTSKWTQVLGKERVPRGTPRTKPQKKQLAKYTVRYALEEIYGPMAASRKPGVDRSVQRKGYPPVFTPYLTSKKKDDLADSLLQVLGFLKRQRLTTPREKKSGKPKKRKRGEIPEPEIDDPSRMDQGMYKMMMKRKLPKEEPVTMYVMRATLKAWKCKGYSSLKRPQLLEFFDLAKAAREKKGLSTALVTKAASEIKVETKLAGKKRKTTSKTKTTTTSKSKTTTKKTTPKVQEPVLLDSPESEDEEEEEVIDENDVEEDSS